MTTHSTSASGAQHRVRTAQKTAILPFYASTNTPLNKDLPNSRKLWRRKPSTRRRDSASLLFERFLQSRVAGGPAHIGMAQPNGVVTFLGWLDSCSEKIRTAVHARDCEAVGTSELSSCSTTEEGCTLRYAHDSLRTNYVSKLAMAYERDMWITHDWNSALRTGNPVRSDLVTQYMAFIMEGVVQRLEGGGDVTNLSPFWEGTALEWLLQELI